jgi:alginate O-acetyltransferase complex protein AlgI
MAAGVLTIRNMAPLGTEQSSGVATVAVRGPQLPAADRSSAKRELQAAPNFLKFCALAAQLGLLAALFRLYHTEDVAFEKMAAIVFGAFAVHYWLPFRFKEAFLAAASLGGAFFILSWHVAAWVIAAGLAIFLILRAPVVFRLRLLGLCSIFGVLGYGCATHRLPLPSGFYAIFGGIFMFRIIVYAYDMAYSREPARFTEFLNYFFILPNYVFTFFPVIDFKTMRRSYYQRDAHEIAQQGIRWMMRGFIQLCLYRLVFYFNDGYIPDRVTTFRALAANMVLTYLLFLNVSGRFHIIAGMLHLFGYDLPETNRRFFLSRGFVDMFRRFNIYWKDFMMKTVYYPFYFKFRKRGDFRARLGATAAVFVVSWALHPYQTFWLIGDTTFFRLTDAIFWTIIGGGVVATVWYTENHKPPKRPIWQTRTLHGVQIAATFAFMAVLWTMWSSLSFSSFLYLITHWTGAR